MSNALGGVFYMAFSNSITWFTATAESVRNSLRTLKNKMLRGTVAKAIAYRLSATFFAQIVSLALFRSVEVNTGVLLADGIQFCWYYVFEKVWNK